MNILVIGGGGREHALAWKIAQSSRVAKVFVAPGNAGTARERELSNVALTSIADLVAFAQREHRPYGRGSGSSACRRRGGRLQTRGTEDLRAAPGGGATRELQGFRQGLHDPPRHSDCRV